MNKRRVNFIHPLFTMRGGAEKVVLDMVSWCKEGYSTQLFTLFSSSMLSDVEHTHVADGVFMSNILGYKANPFIESDVKKLAKIIADTCTSDDLFVLSNFPATLIFYEAVQMNRSLSDAKALFLCFEPDRLLYHKESKKYGFLPKQLHSVKYSIASSLMQQWKKKDRAVMYNDNTQIITLSKFVNVEAEGIYPGKKAVKVAEHYTPFSGKLNKEKSIKKVNDSCNLNIKNDELIFLSVGRIEDGKGVDDLVDAFKEISKTHENIRLIIGGKGSLADVVKKKAEGESNIHYLGFIPDEIIEDVYAVSDVFVFLGEKETGGPLTVIEAMAKGLTVLVPDDGGAAYEIVKNGSNGFITPLNKYSVRESIENIIKLKENKQLGKIKNNALHWAKTYATAAKAKKDFLHFINKNI